MSKRNIIMLVFAIFVGVSLTIGGALLLANKPNQSNIINSSISSDGYYVEKGLEKLAKLARPAVEGFAKQDVSESVVSRGLRLEKYFSTDSLVYEYPLDNIGGSIIKSSSKLTSVVSYGGEDAQITLSAIVITTFYSKTNQYTKNQTYLISFNQNSDGQYDKPYDIEEQQL